MYLGRIAEIAPTEALYAAPLHPYTEALISAVPSPDPEVEARRERIILKGDVPSPANPPPGCVFSTRCPKVFDRCRVEVPALLDKGGGRRVACHLHDQPTEGRGLKAAAPTTARSASMKLRHILSGGGGERALRLRGAGRARVGRPAQHPLLAGGVDHDARTCRAAPRTSQAREPRARAAGALRREGRAGALSRRGDPDGRERRGVGGPDSDHLEAQGRAALVGRHAGDRRRRGLHLAVLHRPERRLRAAAELQRREASRRSTRRRSRSPSAVPKPFPYGPLVGAQSPILQKAQFADCLGAKAPDLHRGQHQADRHRAVHGDRLQGQRRGDARGQPELPRSGQARLRHRWC